MKIRLGKGRKFNKGPIKIYKQSLRQAKPVERLQAKPATSKPRGKAIAATPEACGRGGKT